MTSEETTEKKPLKKKAVRKKAAKKTLTDEEKLRLAQVKLEEKEETVRIKRAKANKEERSDKAQASELISVADYKHVVQRAAEACRGQLYRIVQLSPQLATERDPNNIAKTLRDSIDDALNEFITVSFGGLGDRRG